MGIEWIKIEKEEYVPIGVDLIFWDKRPNYLPLISRVRNDREYGLVIFDNESYLEISSFSHYSFINKP